MTNSFRCALYYFRTREFGSTVLLLMVLALLTGVWIHLGSIDIFSAEIHIQPALIAIIVIGVHAEGPCQVFEHVTSARIAALRLAHRGGLLLLASAVLLIASPDLTLVRNTLGFGGIFLLFVPFVEPSAALMPSLTLGLSGMLASPTASWNWAAAPITDGTADSIAAATCGLGLLLYTWVKRP